MTAKQAAAALDVTVPTIYAYVSRGLIRSEETGESKRTRRYYAEDVERLIQQKTVARNPATVTDEALHWGTPLLESALTLITDEAPYYRGHSALRLAERHTIEQVAGLLWLDDLKAEVFAFADHPGTEKCLRLFPQLNRLQAMQAALPVAGADDLTAYDLSTAAVVKTGASIMRLLGAVAIAAPLDGRDLASALATHWTPDQPEAGALISSALVLCADHELNASSFTARVIAGAGANPYAVVTGALSAFQGIKHGGAAERAGVFLREVEMVDDVRVVIAERLRRGESIPGFGHPIYAGGFDPRGEKLLTLIEVASPDNHAAATVREIATLIDRAPNVDASLATLGLTLGIAPAQAALIFALGRTVGWIAHAIEQYDGRMIRPRARYIGQQPESSD